MAHGKIFRANSADIKQFSGGRGGNHRLALALVYVSAIFGMLFVSEPTAWGQPLLDVGPNTFEIRSDESNALKFLILEESEPSPVGFEQPGFDDTAFTIGAGPFGSGGNCSLQLSVRTDWPINTQLLVRRAVSIPAAATRVRITVSIDNDIIGIFFNGTRIAQPTRHEGCPGEDDFQFDIPQSLVQTGENLIAFQLLDRGVEGFFDAKVFADIPADQVTETVLIQQAPSVPISDVRTRCSTFSSTESRSLTEIAYSVDSTGQQGHLSIEQLSSDNFRMRFSLQGRLMSSAMMSPLQMQVSRSPEFAQLLASGADHGALSIDSAFSRVTGDLMTCVRPPTNAITCPDKCEYAGTVAEIGAVIAGAGTSAGVITTAADAAGVVVATKAINKLVDKCKAGCAK